MIEVLAAHYALSGVLTLVVLLVAAVVGIALNLRADRRAAGAVAAGLPDQPMWTFEALLGGDPTGDVDGDGPDMRESGVDTPGCDCGHEGMALSWHLQGCAWRSAMELAYGGHSEASERVVPDDYQPRHATVAAAGDHR